MNDDKIREPFICVDTGYVLATLCIFFLNLPATCKADFINQVRKQAGQS